MEALSRGIRDTIACSWFENEHAPPLLPRVTVPIEDTTPILPESAWRTTKWWEDRRDPMCVRGLAAKRARHSKVVEVLQARPGIDITEIAAETGWPIASVRAVLRRLMEKGLVRVRRHTGKHLRTYTAVAT